MSTTSPTSIETSQYAPVSVDRAQSLLQRIYGYSSLRAHQVEAIEELLRKRDVLAILPTGGGKSMCYVLPALLYPGFALVLSPLISLIRDQVQALQKVGIPAVALDSLQTSEERQSVMEAIKSRQVKLVFVSPERLANNRFREFLSRFPISLVAIDEAHCVSQWGSFFRPDYRTIGKHIEELGEDIPRIALTATATEQVRDEMIEYLALREPYELARSPLRENLHIHIEKFATQDERTLALVDQVLEESGKGIVYVNTRKQAFELHRELKQHGVEVGVYHAGLNPDQRSRNQDKFSCGKIECMVATTAFGMGIDLPDIRFVHHFGLPKNIEGYVQEVGRAGRDGLASHCSMLYMSKDYYVQKFVVEKAYPDRALVRELYTRLGEFEDEWVGYGELVEQLGSLCKLKDKERDNVEKVLRMLKAENLLRVEQEYQQIRLCRTEARIPKAFLDNLDLMRDIELDKLSAMQHLANSGASNVQKNIKNYFGL